jgi:hypothetical protein
VGGVMMWYVGGIEVLRYEVLRYEV